MFVLMADVAVPYAVVVVIGGVGCDLLTRSIDRIVVIEDTGVRLAVICTVYSAARLWNTALPTALTAGDKLAVRRPVHDALGLKGTLSRIGVIFHDTDDTVGDGCGFAGHKGDVVPDLKCARVRTARDDRRPFGIDIFFAGNLPRQSFRMRPGIFAMSFMIYFITGYNDLIFYT